MNANPFRKPYTYRPGFRNTVAGKRAWRNRIDAEIRQLRGEILPMRAHNFKPAFVRAASEPGSMADALAYLEGL